MFSYVEPEKEWLLRSVEPYHRDKIWPFGCKTSRDVDVKVGKLVSSLTETSLFKTWVLYDSGGGPKFSCPSVYCLRSDDPFLEVIEKVKKKDNRDLSKSTTGVYLFLSYYTPYATMGLEKRWGYNAGFINSFPDRINPVTDGPHPELDPVQEEVYRKVTESGYCFVNPETLEKPFPYDGTQWSDMLPGPGGVIPGEWNPTIFDALFYSTYL